MMRGVMRLGAYTREISGDNFILERSTMRASEGADVVGSGCVELCLLVPPCVSIPSNSNPVGCSSSAISWKGNRLFVRRPDDQNAGCSGDVSNPRRSRACPTGLANISTYVNVSRRPTGTVTVPVRATVRGSSRSTTVPAATYCIY